MVNTELLNEKIRQSGLKIGFIAQELGITRQGLYYKITNERAFKPDEIKILCNLLNINSKSERADIFLANL